MNNEITAISILASGRCNLNCKYCFLHKNKSLYELDKLVQKSWEDGTYITNIVSSLKKLNANFENIKGLTIWGGEPFLNLKQFNKYFFELFNYFPNLNDVWTSTNFSTDINEIINLLKLFDEYANNSVNFRIQISMDSIYYEDGHNLQLSFYIKQMEQLLNNLNNIQFKNIHLNISLRPTIEESQFLELFLNEEKLTEYIDYILQFDKTISELMINKNITYSPVILPTATYPSHATSLDGITYANIVRIWDNFKTKYNINQDLLSYSLGRITNDSLFKMNYECSNLLHNLTILPDGSITCCINSYVNNYDLYKKELIEENAQKALEELQTEEYYSFNPLNMTDKEIEKRLWIIQNGVKNNIFTYKYFSLKTCQELLKVNQISNIYHNYDLLFKHITLINFNLGCMFYNLHESQLPYLNSPSTYRKYLNGVVEYYNNQRKNQYLLKLEEEPRKEEKY